MDDFQVEYFLDKICLEGILAPNDYKRNLDFCLEYLRSQNDLTKQERNQYFVDLFRAVGKLNYTQIDKRKMFVNNFGNILARIDLINLCGIKDKPCSSYSRGLPTTGTIFSSDLGISFQHPAYYRFDGIVTNEN